MAAFTAQDVKALREKTGCGMMDCKKALVQADGDMDKAIDFLREQGLAKQAKKASRIAAEGVAYATTSDDNSVGVVIEVNAETDFVAKNDSFMEFVKACAATVIEQNPADVEALLALQATGSDKTVAELLQEKVLTIGENIQIRRFERMEGACVAYVHAGGKIGVLVNFDTDLSDKPEFVAYGKDVAMQIAALNTAYLNKDEVPAEVVEHEKAIMVEELINKVFSLNSQMVTDAGAVCSYRADEPDLMVYVDEGQVSQILINLVKNAVQAGAHHITITGRMGQDDEVILLVSNDGEPISHESQEQIFVPFFTTKAQGSGIGLSISRQIMRNHNGTIELTRSDSTETVFCLTFR